MLSINTNISAIRLQNIVTTTNNNLSTVLNRMSTGYKIKNASNEEIKTIVTYEQFDAMNNAYYRK